MTDEQLLALILLSQTRFVLMSEPEKAQTFGLYAEALADIKKRLEKNQKPKTTKKEK